MEHQAFVIVFSVSCCLLSQKARNCTLCVEKLFVVLLVQVKVFKECLSANPDIRAKMLIENHVSSSCMAARLNCPSVLCKSLTSARRAKALSVLSMQAATMKKLLSKGLLTAAQLVTAHVSSPLEYQV